MWPSIISLVVFVLFVIFLAVLFLKDIFVVFVNTILLYAVALRVWKDWKQRHLRDYYVLAVLFSAMIVLLTGTVFPFWWATLVAVYAIVLVFIAQRIVKK